MDSIVKALRCCVTNYNSTQSRLCNKCPYKEYADGKSGCENKLKADAADALEAANERIVNLLTALHLANEKLAYVDCQPYTEIDGEEMIDDWVKTLVYEELHTQIDGERKDGKENGN